MFLDLVRNGNVKSLDKQSNEGSSNVKSLRKIFWQKIDFELLEIIKHVNMKHQMMMQGLFGMVSGH